MGKCIDLEFVKLLQKLSKGEKRAFLEVIKLISKNGTERPKSWRSL